MHVHGVSLHCLPPEVSSEKRLKKAEMLLGAGANPNLTDPGGWTVVHQCAHTGDLPLLQMAVRKEAKVVVRNNQGQLPVEQAIHRGHAPLVSYLERQSCDLRSLCRLAIREAMGKRSYRRLDELPLPSQVKVFLNYGSPYQGFSATVVPESPWLAEQLHSGSVEAEEVGRFIQDHASQGFLEQHSEVLEGRDMQGLVEAFQSMFLWESFKSLGYEEPIPPPPRYSLERVKKEGAFEGLESAACCLS